MLAAAETSAPAAFRVRSKKAVFISRWSVVAILIPLNGFLLSKSRLMLWRTGMKRETQSIFLSPPSGGARDRSLTQ